MKLTTKRSSFLAAIAAAVLCLCFLWLSRDSFLTLKECRYDATREGEEWLLAPGEQIELSFVKEYKDIQQIYLMFLGGEAYDEGTIQVDVTHNNGELVARHLIPQATAREQYLESIPLTEEQSGKIEKGELCTIHISWTGARQIEGEGVQIYREIPVIYSYYDRSSIISALVLIPAIFLVLALHIKPEYPWIKRSMAVIKALYTAALPAMAYIVFEYITGNIIYITGLKLILNLIFFYIFYLVIFLVTNRLRFTNIFTTVVLALIAAAEYFVVLFRGRPIMVWDVLAVGTAATVAGNYTYQLTSHLVLAALLVIFLAALASKFSFRIRGWKKRAAVSAVGAAALCFYMYGFYNVAMTKYDLAINMWDPASSYAESGYVLSTFVYIDYMIVDKPEGYSASAVQEIIDRQEPASPPAEDAVTPVNLICIMNESFSDLRVAGEFGTSQEFLPFIDSLEENTVRGNLYMPIFGSMTCNSEYEFLTGNNMAFLPSGSVAYQVYVKPNTYSIVSTLKAEGYDAVAMHPFPAANWNRNKVFDYMGFDQFLADEDFKDSERVRDFVSDKGTYDKIIELVEAKDEGEKLFVFDVTMQNHGGYDVNYPNFPEDVFLTEYSGYPKTDQYLSLIKKSDEAFEYLINYFKGVEEPTMIVMFGDHQPSIETGFYEQIMGKPYENWGIEEQMKRFITPFIIWTNYEMDSEYYDQLSAHYLSTLMLEKANIPLTDFNVFLKNMMTKLPVVHPIGYCLPDGVPHDWVGWRQSEYYPLFHDIELIEYNSVLDYGKRIDSIYAPKP